VFWSPLTKKRTQPMSQKLSIAYFSEVPFCAWPLIHPPKCVANMLKAWFNIWKSYWSMLNAYWSMLKEFLRKAPTQNRGVMTPSQKKNTSYVAKNRSWVHITRLSRIEEHVFYHFFWTSLYIFNTFSTHVQHTHRQGSLPVQYMFSIMELQKNLSKFS